jgi:uncharacterized iron-regulated membrane protein
MNYRLFRRIFQETHLWLGIASGGILFVVCLSGTILTFQTEYRQIAEPARYFVKVSEGKPPLAADELIAKIEAERPTMKVVSITIPEQPNRTVTMNLASPEQVTAMGQGERRQRSEGARGQRPEGERRQRPEGGRPESAERNPEGQGESPPALGEGNQRPQGRSGGGSGGVRVRNFVQVNPYTGEIVGEGPTVVDPFMMSMLRLHRFLWLPIEIGRPVVGIATIIFCVLCLSGLILWLPKTLGSFLRWGSWRVGLRVRFNKGFWALLYDLHNTVGFYLLIPALILALTGLCWSFAWYRDGISNLLGDRVFGARMQRPAVIEPVEESAKPLSVGEMIARKNELLPGPGDIFISIPTNRESAMVIRKGRSGFFDLNIPDRSQWDPYRGTVIPVEFFGKTVEVERFIDRPLGSKIVVSIRGLHFGDITGMSSKIFFFIVCLFATTLPVTGTIWWSKKLRTKYKRRQMQRNA